MGFWQGPKWGCGALFGLWVAGGLATCTTKNCGGTGNAKTDLIDTPKDALTKMVDFREFEDIKTPTGDFKIDFVTQRGSNKQYEFDILGRDKNGAVKAKVRELGSETSRLSRTARFNVIFFDRVYPEKSGIGFNLYLLDEGDIAVSSYNNKYPTVIISKGERVCGMYSSNDKIEFSQIQPDLRRTKVLKRSEITIPEKSIHIPQSVRDQHDTSHKPVIISPRSLSLRQKENSR